MFTPPPSPIPSRRPEMETDRSLGSEESPDLDVASCSLLAVPRQSSSTRSPASQQTSKYKRDKRRVWIPLLAVILVALAISTRWRQPRLATATSTPPPALYEEPTTGNAWRKHAFPHLASGRHLRKKRALAVTAPTAASSTSSALPSVSSLVTASQTAPAIPNPPFPVPTPFPQPFDTFFSYNFTTTSCQSFFQNTVITNITVRACRPLSLLLPASAAFIQAQSNLTLLTSIVGGTCATTQPADQCGRVMSWLANQMQRADVCGKDLDARNALTVEALEGFQNYAFMRQAGCLINQNSNTYCLVDAVASASPADYYFYALPLGTPLPNNTVPSCSTCVQSVLSIYATQANNQSLQISKTYPAAAERAILACGPKYAVAIQVSNGAASLVGSNFVVVWAMLAAVGFGIGVLLPGL